MYILGIGIVAANLAFTTYDLATLGESKPKIYGFGETLLAVPQTLVLASITGLVGDDDDAWLPAALTLWSAALATHGIYTLANSSESDETSPRIVLSVGGQF